MRTDDPPVAGAAVEVPARNPRPVEGAPAPVAAGRLPADTQADPEVALMLRVQAGDPDAFPELFRRLAPRVLQYVRRLVGSEARAEEVTQDVFIQVYRFRDRYQPQSRLATWVFTIATNLSLNELRRPERQLRVDLWDDDRPEGPPLPDPDARTPEENASAIELSRSLQAAVGALPEKQRAALLLSRVDGLAYDDVAAVLGCSEGAVKALIFRATQSLKKTLREFL
jgi:RNA polymerase sigma-70 factor, ECF subfamily